MTNEDTPAMSAAHKIQTCFIDAEASGCVPKTSTIAGIIEAHSTDTTALTAAVNKVLDAKLLTRVLRQELADAVGRTPEAEKEGA